MGDKKEKFIFSIVMAVYNVEPFLKDSIESIINQTLDFEENIQLILVNDGSTDNSLGILENYQKLYPNNIVVLSKENGGVSSARNFGLKNATGKYVNFMDSDDWMAPESLKEVNNFFLKYPTDDYDFVVIPVSFFEAWNYDHPLNYKFDECSSDFCNVMDNPQYFQCFTHSSFIKRNAIGFNEFDTKLIHFEDAVFINKILMEKMKFGLVRNAKYYYRKRFDSSAVTSSSTHKKEYFTTRLKYGHLELIDYAINKLGYVPEFLQNILIYDLNWLVQISDFKNVLKNVLDSEEISEFYEYLKEIFSYIEMDSILKHPVVSSGIKSFLAYYKNQEFHIETTKRKVFLKTNKQNISRLHTHNLWIDIVNIKKGFLYISGSFSSNCYNECINIQAIKSCNGEKTVYNSKFYDYSTTPRKIREFLGIPWIFYYNFDFKIPIAKNETSNISFKIIYNEGSVEVKMKGKLKFKHYAELSEEAYYSVFDNQILLFRDNKLFIEEYSYIKMIKNEFRTILNILNDFSINAFRAIFYRIIYLILFPFFKNKSIWILMDRQNESGDNAEHLFQYVQNQKDNIKKYFIISKDSDDYKRLNKKYNGKIVSFGSFKHKFLYMISSKIISSHPDNEILNPFYFENLKFYSHVSTSKIYFLQHGVPKYNMSNWLVKYNHDMSLLVAVSDWDYNSYKNGYNFEEEIIQILGYPRFDNLSNQNMKKQILLLLSWRNYIKNKEMFIHSEYYSKLNSLINNEELIRYANKKGYQIIFKLHPLIMKYIDSFDKHEHVIFDEETKYHDLLCDSALMITDYSSVAFDFAYLKKPIIYYRYSNDYHFDEETCYFDEEIHGFGDIIKEEEDLVNKVKSYLNNDCLMEEKYKKNVDKFFKFNDKNNSKRVYDWIKKN